MIEEIQRVLIFSPHSDDAELGAGGFISRCLNAGVDVAVQVAVTKTDKMLHKGDVHGIVRTEEFYASMEVLGVPNYNLEIVFPNESEDFDLCAVPKSKMVYHMDKNISHFEPDTVLLPVPSFHQEHIYVNECAVAACRPTKRDSPIKRVFAYEYPAANWGASAAYSPSMGGVYIDIHSHLQTKLLALSKHKSQFNNRMINDDLVSPSSVELLAKMRGREAGYPEAEMFYILRWLID